MNFNRFAMSRAALGVCSALLLLGVSPALAQRSGPATSSSIIDFSANSELRGADAAGLLTSRLQLRSGMDEIRSAFVQNPAEGLQVQRFHQYFKGLRVSHGAYSLTSKNGLPSFAFGKFYPVPDNFVTVPAVDEKTALANALKEINATTYAWELEPSKYPKGRLELCEDFRRETLNGEVRLAWVFDVFAEAPLSASKIYVDAQTGKVLLSDAMINHVAAKGASLYSDSVSFQASGGGSVYSMIDGTRGGGVITYNMNRGNNPYSNINSYNVVTGTSAVFPKDPSVDAHWGATVVYDYWKNTHNRLSYDGGNRPLYNLVHYSTNYANAFWAIDRMVYGDGSVASGMGPLTSLDVCAHEIGHGVCQQTAQLVYSRESGAMNEGFSDIWGAVIEQYGDPHEKDAKAKDMWLIGEELATAPFRSMRDPKRYSQPDTYQGVNWLNANSPTCDATLNDNCGVHINSGVLNKWFFLITDGGTGTNDLGNFYKVAGLGSQKSSNIAYATELILDPSANYADCRTASIAAATTLYGSCSKEVEAVTRAWYAVGVGTDYADACAPQIAFNGGVATSISENVSVNDCKASKVISIPVSLNGSTPLAGDSATITATVVGGNAVAGTDYSLTVPAATFFVGGASTANIGITVYDNGYINTGKYLDLKLSLNARGSNASLALIGDSIRVTIADNEAVPSDGAQQGFEVLQNATLMSSGSPFAGGSTNARSQYIYLPSELLAAGVVPNAPISAVEFNLLSVSSKLPYSNYTVKMGNSAIGTLNNGWITGLTQVYNAASYSTVFGWNKLSLSTPFVWNGVDNLVVETSFSNTGAGSPAPLNDQASAGTGVQSLSAYATSATLNGSVLPFSAVNQINLRPVITLDQDVPAAAVETAQNATRTWNIPAARDAYFLSDGNNKLMVGIKGATDSLGCVTAQVSAAGNGFESARFANALSRSKKEFMISSSANLATTAYTGTLYYTDAELGGVDLTKTYILYTTAASDADIRSTNSRVIKVDEVITAKGFKGFRGNFTGFGRYFLIDGNVTLDVSGPAVQRNDMWTGANPFSSYPVLNWSLSRSEQVSIRLLDVTGKLVYSNDTRLEAGSSKLELRAPNALAPGTYVLQVIRPNAVFTRQLIKQ